MTALGVMLVIEGLLPFLMPQVWRETFKRMMALKDGQLRFVGLLSIIMGLVIAFISRG